MYRLQSSPLQPFWTLLRGRSSSFKPGFHCGIGWRNAIPGPDRPRDLGIKIDGVL
jgi:hypothetical protein